MRGKTQAPKLANSRARFLSKTLLAAAIAGMTFYAQAGKITSVSSASGAAGFGGWNLGNVQVELNGTGSTFDPATGAYSFAADSDLSYQANVFDDTPAAGTQMGIVLAKDWPVGEPSGIKIINDDPNVKDKPANCIMATSYLEGSYLDSTTPQQVICSSPFQTHKRFKVAMLPATVDVVGRESIDLVFNTEAEEGTREYEVFQKINIWTGMRLEGFKVEVGFGVGANFQTAIAAGVDLNNLNIAVPSTLWSETQLATFSAGLFGPTDKHTGEVGFFDPNRRAGFYIDEYVAGVQPLTDTLTATRPLPSNYADVPAGAGSAAQQFGPWLPNSMLPEGIFFDDDGNPLTDAALVAWYGHNPATGELGWMGGSQDPDGPFSAIPASEITAMGANLSYTSGVIDDLVNIGLNYVVRVGDVNSYPTDANGGKTFTIRITPTADTSTAPPPSFVGATPDPLLLFTSSEASVLLQPEETFPVGAVLTARVGDADLNIDPAVAETVDVTISTDSGLSEPLTLVEQGSNRGMFAALLPEAFSQVEPGTVVTLTYVDDGTPVTSSSTAEGAPVPILSDVSISDLAIPTTLADGLSRTLMLTITNDRQASEPASGEVLLTGSDGSEFRATFSNLRLGGKQKFNFRWTAELSDPSVPETVEWVASVTVNGQIVDGAEAVTAVTVKTGKNIRR